MRTNPRAPLALVGLALLLGSAAQAQRATPPASFTIEQVKSYPFPNELTAAATGSRIAWAFNEQGRRNIYVAEGPSFAARRLTNYMLDDGQELTSVALSPDGRYVVYVRGGDHGTNWEAPPPNPTSMPEPPKIQLWSVPFEGGEPKLLSDGDEPAVSPKGDVVAFVKDGQAWVVPIDGAAPARRMFSARGAVEELRWSPDGSRVAFVSDRDDHAFVGLFTGDSTPIRWIAPSTTRDGMPRWSPDGRQLVFARRPGAGGAPDSALVARPQPWALWVADAASGQARELWKSPETLRGSVPTTHGGINLHWGANGRIAFLSYMDGWPHLYSIAATGGEPLLLTPGSYMAEYVTLSADGKYLVFAGNAGKDPDDIDRRHVVKAPIDRSAPEVMTPGKGLEWTPVVTGDGKSIAFIGATAQRPPLPAVMPAAGGRAKLIGEDRVPGDFPTAQLVVPTKVVIDAPDGVKVHSQLFAPRGATGRRPAIIFVHGGPPRQMLLGWHYSDYYTNAYASNQYLASKGYVVLSVNFRLGIGYGYDFHRPPGAGAQGAAEYQDVKAAAEWLARQPNVDPKRIGIYGGSYGGFLTALALGRNSDLFAAGVDVHGVHDWTAERVRGLLANERYEKVPDRDRALDVAWSSSPVSAVSTWKSPVLLIHGDDDRNVRFSQTVDLVQRLAAARVPFEQIVIPDDTHHMMKHANWVLVDRATADFFDRKLGGSQTAATAGSP
jgi:dipeptidyl aminopeptidase/acylaminoacyl peptidase